MKHSPDELLTKNSLKKGILILTLQLFLQLMQIQSFIRNISPTSHMLFSQIASVTTNFGNQQPFTTIIFGMFLLRHVSFLFLEVSGELLFWYKEIVWLPTQPILSHLNF